MPVEKFQVDRIRPKRQYRRHHHPLPSRRVSFLPRTISPSYTMSPKDRTAEFHSTLNSIKSRSSLPLSPRDESKQRLLSNGPEAGPSRVAAAGGGKSEFGRMAGGIAKDINATTLKLQKLAQRECEGLGHLWIPSPFR